MNHTYDYPLPRAVDLADLQNLPESVVAKTAVKNSVKIVDASAFVGATPAACTLSIGDGTTVDKYGTIEVAAGGTTGDAAVITLNLTADAYEIIDQEEVVITGTTAPAGAVTDFTLHFGYY